MKLGEGEATTRLGSRTGDALNRVLFVFSVYAFAVAMRSTLLLEV